MSYSCDVAGGGLHQVKKIDILHANDMINRLYTPHLQELNLCQCVANAMEQIFICSSIICRFMCF